MRRSAPNPRARVIDFRVPSNNRFLAVRELKLTGLRTPNYNRRADIVCFVNGLPLVFIELKAVYKNIRAGFDGNLRDYMDETCRTRVPSQRLSRGEQWHSGQIRLDHERVGPLQRVEKKRGERTREHSTPKTC